VADRERVLAFLHELQLADEEVAAVLADLDELAGETERVRSGALGLEAFSLRLPAERERVDGERARAETELAAARGVAADAEAVVHDAREENADEARRFAVRARDRLAVAERRVAEARAAGAALERRAREAEEEGRALETRARELAHELRGRPRLAQDAGEDPRPGLAGVSEWAGAAGAALFVARGQLATERDAVIREANELGALALGEPLTAASAAVVTRRVERELASDDA
jgi:hypothetical protein